MDYHPKDPRIKKLFDEVYGADDGDDFSTRSRLVRIMANATRHNRGNVLQQNADFVDRDMLEKFRMNLQVIFDERPDKKK